jgi:NAD(P)-dependent dehydrogenase (short-subunit alcohol dehydrogenase family)
VNVVAPGMIETDMTRGINEKTQGDLVAQIPLGRLGSVDERRGGLLSAPTRRRILQGTCSPSTAGCTCRRTEWP